MAKSVRLQKGSHAKFVNENQFLPLWGDNLVPNHPQKNGMLETRIKMLEK